MAGEDVALLILGGSYSVVLQDSRYTTTDGSSARVLAGKRILLRKEPADGKMLWNYHWAGVLRERVNKRRVHLLQPLPPD